MTSTVTSRVFDVIIRPSSRRPGWSWEIFVDGEFVESGQAEDAAAATDDALLAVGRL